MISIRCSALLVLLALASTAIASDLSTCPERTCPEDNFIFTCTGSGEVTWTILNANDVQVTNYTVENDLTVGDDDSFGDNGQFMILRLNENSTRLWFRANPNYNGFTVRCEDDENNMECNNLMVFGPPTMPENFLIQNNTVTRTSVRLSWNVPLNYDCMIAYYNIMVNGVTYNVSGNYTWFDLPVVFGTEYCPMISARDAAIRSGTQVASNPLCIDVDYPPAVMLNDNMYIYRTGEFVNITVSWMLPTTNTPDATNYTIRYNETYTNDMGSGSGSDDDDDDDNMRMVTVLAGQNSVLLRGSFREGSTYFVAVTASNVFGPGDSARNVFIVPPPTTMPPESNGGLSVGAIVGIVIGAIVGLILIVVIVVVIVVIVMVAGRGGDGNKPHELTKL